MRALVLVPYSAGGGSRSALSLRAVGPVPSGAGDRVSSFRPSRRRSSTASLRTRETPRKALRMLERLASRFVEAWSAAEYDVVVVQREAALIGPAWTERMSRTADRPSYTTSMTRSTCLTSVLRIATSHTSKFPWKTAASADGCGGDGREYAPRGMGASPQLERPCCAFDGVVTKIIGRVLVEAIQFHPS